MKSKKLKSKYIAKSVGSLMVITSLGCHAQSPTGDSSAAALVQNQETTSPLKMDRQDAQLRNLTKSLLDKDSQYQQVRGSSAALQEALIEAASQRRAALIEALGSNTAAAISNLMSHEVASGLSSSVQAYVEHPLAEVEGRFVIRDAMLPDGESMTFYRLLTHDEKEIPVHFASRDEKIIPRSGSQIKLWNTISIPGDEKTSDPGAIVVSHALGSASTVTVVTAATTAPLVSGSHKIILNLVNFQDQPTHQILTFNDANNLVNYVSNYYEEVSFHQFHITGVAVNWITAPVNSTASCDAITTAVATATDKSSANSGLVLSQYQHRANLFPKAANCPWLGMADIGLGSGTFGRIWLNGVTWGTPFGHELGHNLGMIHSNGYDCKGTSISKTCTTVEYGDPADIMGKWTGGHLNARQKEYLGWLNTMNTPPIQTVTSTGTYFLEPYETETTQPKALKILKETLPDGTKNYYYVEYRQPIGQDNGLANLWGGATLTSGVHIHIGNSSYYTMNPAIISSNPTSVMVSNGHFADATFLPNIPFNDANAVGGGLSIVVQSADATGAKVSITLGTVVPAVAPCVQGNPTLGVVPNSTTWIAPGQSTSFAVNVINNDSATCPSSVYTLTATPQTGLTSTLSNSTLTVAPGQTGGVSIVATAGASTGNGIYSVGITSKNSVTSTLTSSGLANVGVKAVCTPVAPTFTFSDAQQSAVLGDMKVYHFTLTNNDSAGCAASPFQIAIQSFNQLGSTASPSTFTLNPGQQVSSILYLWEITSNAASNYSIAVSATNTATRLNALTTLGLNVSDNGCVTNAPKLTMSPSNITVKAGGTATYTITLLDMDSPTCINSVFSYEGVSTPYDFPMYMGSNNILATPSQTVPNTMTIKVPVQTTPGVYSILFTGKERGSSAGGQATATLTISP